MTCAISEPLGRPAPNGVPAWYETLLPGEYARLTVGLAVGVVTISPEAAAKILDERNPRNRSLVKRQVALLRAAMEAKEFRLTGEPLIFDDQGMMRNGQHRLTACVECGTPFQTVVVVGVDPEVFRNIDQHTKRSTAQVFGILGYANPTLLAGGLMFFHTFLRTGRIAQPPDGQSLTVDAQIRFLGRHPWLERSAALAGSRRGSILTSASLAVAAHYVYGRADEQLADQFFHALFEHRAPEDPSWEGVGLFLKRMVANLSSTEKLPTATISGLMTKAWNALYDRRTVKTLKYLPKEEYPRVSGWEYEDGLPVLKVRGVEEV
jgi:hypothetical protein